MTISRVQTTDGEKESTTMMLDSRSRLAQLERRMLYLKRGLMASAVIGILGWGAQLMAQDTSWAPPGFHVFEAGEPAVAADVNDNFRWLVERLEALESQASAVPVGTIVAFAGETAPPGWEMCDGHVISTKDYPELAEVLGTAWGDDESVRVPDLRGRFLRGLDQGVARDADPERALGSYQDFAIENITGALNRVAADTFGASAASGAFAATKSADLVLPGTSGAVDALVNFTLDASQVVSTSTETRPANAAVNFIIKT